jgi:hypothetical protein
MSKTFLRVIHHPTVRKLLMQLLKSYPIPFSTFDRRQNCLTRDPVENTAVPYSRYVTSSKMA